MTRMPPRLASGSPSRQPTQPNTPPIQSSSIPCAAPSRAGAPTRTRGAPKHSDAANTRSRALADVVRFPLGAAGRSPPDWVRDRPRPRPLLPGCCRPATAASTGGSSPPCARPGSTAARAARPSRRSAANVEFFPTAAAAQQRGYRACKRCRPDASPGLARVGRPRRRRRPGDAPRRRRRRRPRGRPRARPPPRLQRAPPQPADHRRARRRPARHRPRPARPHRAHAARDDRPCRSSTSPSPPGSAACASSTTPSATVFAATPIGAARRRRRHGQPTTAGAVELELPVREPFDADDVLGVPRPRVPFPASSTGTARRYRRALDLPGGHGTVAVAPRERRDGRPACGPRCASPTGATSTPAVRRVRRLLDLDADPVAVDDALGADPALAPLGRRGAGLRVPGSVDPFETAVRAVDRPADLRRRRPHASPGASSPPLGAPLAIDDGPLTPRVPDAGRARRDRSRRCCRCRTAGGARSSSWPARSPPASSSSTPAPIATTSRAALARRARHRSVDGRLRADARPRRPRRVPADRPRRAGRPRVGSASPPATPSAGARGARTPCTTCGRVRADRSRAAA